MWTLDFGRLMLTDEERHEIMLYRSVRMLVEAMLVFWDATGGEGVLGLKNLSALTVSGRRERGQGNAASGELSDYIGSLLRRHRSLRNWKACPSLLNLDL
jgi:hypothetical protein